MRRLVLAFSLTCALVPSPAGADRYVCEWGDVQAVTPDSKDLARDLGVTGGSDLMPLSPQMVAVLRAVPVPPAVNTPPPPNPNPAPGRVASSAAAATAHNQTTIEEFAKTPTATMDSDAAFMDLITRVYKVSTQREKDILWKLYNAEPTTLGAVERVGNAVIKYTMDAKKGPASDSTARPDLLKPNATGGTVRSANGIGVHVTPWGARQGSGTLVNGTALEFQPPADGPWYRLKSGGWVAGIWVDLR